MGLFKKEKVYHVSADLQQLANSLSERLSAQGWKTQVASTDNGVLLQARKGGILRDIIAADRALSILFSRTSDGFKVTMGVGKWLQHIGVTLVEAVLLSELFLVVDVPEMIWNAEVENNILKEIDAIVGAA
ncbi:hypothetical protein HS1genome_0672 [Sulfodiicoccus acidiphilus]|uniref:Uncharacterized protein n=1 Tax=Sulfodiicoccus acidiphilus TaxID=1670455 RepID=A0A348B281_9CREN|nr:hypothetical protein [Sulfodiicoccus acidiphilus]BBD72283.1 hypothetical protein HS1genome_0672 [Sulfodiicoccus acidiphilus]GGT90562.1 hypothetical protein GCM10007116_05490 [Sulfodiicoccus acidiphilus]